MTLRVEVSVSVTIIAFCCICCTWQTISNNYNAPSRNAEYLPLRAADTNYCPTHVPQLKNFDFNLVSVSYSCKIYLYSNLSGVWILRVYIFLFVASENDICDRRNWRSDSRMLLRWTIRRAHKRHHSWRAFHWSATKQFDFQQLQQTVWL